MYGKWFLLVIGPVAALLLIVALLTSFAALAAVGIAMLAAAVILVGLAGRRARQVGAEHGSAAEERRQAGQTERPSASGAPVSGEGGAAEAHRRARITG